MPTPNEHPDAALHQSTTVRQISKRAAARRWLVARRNELLKLVPGLEEALDEFTLPYLRYRIRRWQEVAMLLTLTIAEIEVAETVVQALGLSPMTTELIAVVIGGAATGLAWLIGHESAVAQDPQALAAGRRSWLGVAVAIAGVVLLANLAVRVYYGLLDEEAHNLGSGLVTPLLAGTLLTAVTAALMLVAAFVTAHA